jgi:hypothetical protein
VLEKWRRARDSNPQGPRGPVDFKSALGCPRLTTRAETTRLIPPSEAARFGRFRLLFPESPPESGASSSAASIPPECPRGNAQREPLLRSDPYVACVGARVR